MNIELLAKGIFTKFVYVILLLLLANVAGIFSEFYLNHGRIYGLIPLFNFDQEKNIPTLYSSFAIIICSILLLIISLEHKRKGESWLPWMGLAAIFLFLSIDEVASIHERFEGPVRQSLDSPGLLYVAWVIPYAIALLVLVISYSKFLLELPRRTAMLFIAGGLLFISGAIGFEFVSGRHTVLYGNDDILYAFYYTCEELLEMLGVAVFIYALISYIADKSSHLTITIRE